MVNMLRGIDVSGWQSDKVVNQPGIDFVMIKASEGVSGVSDKLDSQFNTLAGNTSGKPLTNKRYGFYHYARPEQNSSAAAEAAHFLSLVGHHAGYAAMALDYEGAACAYGESWAMTWLQSVYTRTGVKPLLYINASEESSGKYSSIRDAGYPLWLAYWTTDNPKTKCWSNWSIWQYRDDLKVAGENVDADYCMDNMTWVQLAPKYQTSGVSTEKQWEIVKNTADLLTVKNDALTLTIEKHVKGS